MPSCILLLYVPKDITTLCGRVYILYIKNFRKQACEAYREDLKNYWMKLGRPSITTLRILSVTPFSLKKIRKGGEGGTPQIRNLFFGPKSGVFFEQKTQVLALFEEKIWGGNL